MIVKTKGGSTPSESESETWTGEGGWLSTSDVAAKLGYTRQRIHQLVVDGTIPSVRLGAGRYQIPREWIDQHLARTKPIRRKKGGDQ